MKKSHVLITGGAGFIGSNLAKRLLGKGYEVTVLDNLSPQIHGDVPELSSLFVSVRDIVTFVRGTVLSTEDWRTALLGVDTVVHLAAETGTGQSMYQVSKYTDVNIKGTSILLDLLANEKHSIKKILVASSRSIYGEGRYRCERDGHVYPEGRSAEDMSIGEFEVRCPICGNSGLTLLATDESSKIHPSSLYGITKQVQEQMFLLLGQALGIPAVALRYQNVYGAGQSLSNPYTGILSIFSTRIRNGNPIQIFEDGLESRDFVYVDDVVDATILGIENDAADYQVFNVGYGLPTSVMQVAQALKNAYRSPVDISVTGNFRVGDIRHNFADLTKAEKLLGFKPKVSFANGIDLFSTWVNGQAMQSDKYAQSVEEMRRKGLYK